MNTIRHLLGTFIIAVCLMNGGQAAQAAACPAEPFVRNVANAFFGAARSRSPAALSAVVSRYTDLRGIALFALGRYRGLVSKRDEARYVSLTRGFIGRFVAKNSGKITGRSITVIGCSGPASALTVNARTSSGERVVLKLYKARRGYMVRDVNFSSIWLAQQLRSTFVGVVNRNGGDINALYSYLGS